ncbi:MAG TPA: tetratricopeptide repeat protein [Gallionella sp.]
MYRLGVCLLILFPDFAFAKTPAEVFAMASPSIVIVRALDAQDKVISLGSGVVIATAQVITNCHVTDKAARMEVKSGSDTLPAIFRYTDRERDLCQLAVPNLTAPSVKIGSVKGLKIGARVVALGAPQGLELSLSDGIIASLREAGDASIIQTTAPISPGSSGGGLFDEEGRLIGITTFYLSEGQNLNFALPADWIAVLPERAKIAKATAFDESAWLLKAIALEEKKDWNALLAHARAWTKANPRSALAWNSLGLAYGKTGQAEQAIKTFRDALRINPEYADAWNNLGVAYLEADQTDQALKSYREALRINPEDEVAWVNLGIVYGKSGQADQALKAYREALRINPEYAVAWVKLGIAYGKSGQTDQAIKAYREALRINHEDADTWVNLGNAYGESSQADQAINAYREALRINPEYAGAWYNLGLVYGMKDERTQVLEIYRQLRTLDPALADDFFNKVVMPR